jgi:F-type H+-transporting ATPase subunit epsilon
MFDVNIVTPSKQAYTGRASHVVAPGARGLFGVLTQHAPLFSKLEPGVVRIDEESGKKTFFEIDGGMLEVDNNVVTVLTDNAGEKV